MTTHLDTQKRWLQGYYQQAVGLTIIGVSTKVDEEMGDVWPSLLAIDKDGNHYALELSQDEEGNGPGFMFGLPMYTLPEFRTEKAGAK
jgi:hypothetical protein